MIMALDDDDTDELVDPEPEESGDGEVALCILWESLCTLNAACRAAPAAAPAPGCRGDDVGLMGSWPVGG